MKIVNGVMVEESAEDLAQRAADAAAWARGETGMTVKPRVDPDVLADVIAALDGAPLSQRARDWRQAHEAARGR